MFKGSHYELIRNNWQYRLMCQMEDMRLELEPAWASPPPPPNYGLEIDRLRKDISVLKDRLKRYEDKPMIKGRAEDVI